MKELVEGFVLNKSGISNFRYKESEIYLDCDGDRDREDLQLYDLVIDGSRAGETGKFDTVISELAKRFGSVKQIYYYALHEFEVKMYEKLGFKIKDRDPDEDFEYKCIMVKEV